MDHKLAISQQWCHQSPQNQLKEKENDFHLRLKAERQVLLRDEFVEFLRKAAHNKMANHDNYVRVGAMKRLKSIAIEWSI